MRIVTELGLGIALFWRTWGQWRDWAFSAARTIRTGWLGRLIAIIIVDYISRQYLPSLHEVTMGHSHLAGPII